MSKVNLATKLALVALIAATFVFDALMGWAVWFTYAFFGENPLKAPMFWVLALSPIPVTLYCVNRIAAVRRGEYPKI